MSHTIGSIAALLSEQPFRVRYAIQRAGIKARGRAGQYNLYTDEDIPAIRTALAGVGRLVRGIPPTAEAR